MTRTCTAITLTLTLAALPLPALAASHADLAAIDRQVASFLAREIGQADGATPVDPRLRLNPCPQALALSWSGRARTSVLVQCPAPGGWRLFVPVGGAASGGEKAIARGDLVTIIVRGEYYRLSDRGTAMASGFAGEWIEVRPSRKDAKPLQARVVSPGMVDVQLP